MTSTTTILDARLRSVAWTMSDTLTPAVVAEMESSYGIRAFAMTARNYGKQIDPADLLRYVDSVDAFRRAREWELADDAVTLLGVDW